MPESYRAPLVAASEKGSELTVLCIRGKKIKLSIDLMNCLKILPRELVVQHFYQYLLSQVSAASCYVKSNRQTDANISVTFVIMQFKFYL